MALLARIVLAATCLSLAQDFAFHGGSFKSYSKDHAQQDFPSTKGPYKMVMGGEQGTPLTT
jgi:hypothetical protein